MRRLGGRQEKLRYLDSSKLLMSRPDPFLFMRHDDTGSPDQLVNEVSVRVEINKTSRSVTWWNAFVFYVVDGGMINARLESRRTLDSEE